MSGIGSLCGCEYSNTQSRIEQAGEDKKNWGSRFKEVKNVGLALFTGAALLALVIGALAYLNVVGVSVGGSAMTSAAAAYTMGAGAGALGLVLLAIAGIAIKGCHDAKKAKAPPPPKVA